MASTDLILLHGALGAAEQFSPWLSALQTALPATGIHVIELEGHGARPFPAHPFRIDHFVNDLIRQMDESGIAQADIFGYSMGGYVALRTCMLHPERIGRVFTFATKLAWSPETAAKEVKMLDAEKIMAKVPRFAEALEKRHHGNNWRDHLNRTADLMLDLGQSPLLTSETFATIQHRVRMGIGDRDTMVTLEETIAAYRSLPNAELYVMPGTPHPIEQMDVRKACQSLVDWLTAI